MQIGLTDKDKKLAKIIRSERKKVETTILSTDSRVIARVTDGIYRQPGSALRELISNAYDADASEVIIKTDVPRFKSMSIEDNGRGMSPEALTYVLHHIGGSSKRNQTGSELGVTNNKNYDLSPNGRKLIGKIGIGLFSVAQLTQSFEIFTKQKGDNFRTVATVILNQYSDVKESVDNEYETGKVNIWTESANDIDAHGTTIVLNKIRVQTKETLSSKQVWDAIVASKEEEEQNGATPIAPPKYHIGKINENDIYENVITNGNNNSLPWSEKDSPREAFEKLVKCVWAEEKTSNPKPKIADLFDFYLKMIWDISLSIPAEYINESIFDIKYNYQFYPYLIANSPKGQATPLEMNAGETFRDFLDLPEKKVNDFKVVIDNLELSRPIMFENLPVSLHSIKKPMVFVGQFSEEFKGKSSELTGGALKFSAYLIWNSKIAPTEHQGVMIRINNASGTIFDESFLKYQVQELQRKRQVTCEIFVEEGLDGALNIDRESFNFSHPHVVILTRWLHSAFRQLTNANKSLASKFRTQNRDIKTAHSIGSIGQVVQQAWTRSGNDVNQAPPRISLSSDSVYNITDSIDEKDEGYDYFISLSSNLKTSQDETALIEKESKIDNLTEEKIKAITSILASYGVLDNISNIKINEMIYAIYEVIKVEDV